MIKFILTIPEHLQDTVLEQALIWRTTLNAGIGIKIATERRPVHTQVASAVEGEGTGAVALTAPASEPSTSPSDDRSTKVYRVIDTATPVGPVPQSIRIYLIDHPNSTAKQIETATGRGKKSVESAIWMLRHKGIVRESERV